MLRWLRRLIVGLLVLLLLGLAAVAVLLWRLPEDDVAVPEPGGLEVAGEARGTYDVGALTVAIDDDVTISRGGTVLWQSPRDAAFVTAAAGTVDVAEHRGYFWPATTHEDTWTEQSIDSVTANEDVVRIEGTLDGEQAYDALVTADGDGARLTVEADGVDTLTISSGRSSDAGVHGFGEQFDDFDLDGRLIPILVREQGVGRGEQPLSVLADLTNHGAGGTDAMTYAAMATWVTDDLRSVTLDPELPESQAFAVADTRADDRVSLEVWADRASLLLNGADSPAELLQARGGTEIELPDWTQQGAIVGVQGGTDKVRKTVEDQQAAGAEISGVWIQDWSGQRTTDFGDRLWWTWQLDEERYPGFDDLVRELNADGIEVTTYVNPFLVDAAPKGDDDIRNLFAEAEAAGYLVRNRNGATYLLDQGGFDAALVDLTNPDAREWFAGVIRDEVLGTGAVGFMADFGEGLPYDAVLDDGDARDLHNAWPGLWADTVDEACADTECVTWFRSGSLGMDQLGWTGDQMVDFGRHDGLASALLGTLSAGVSGQELTHSDLGGYTSVNAVVKNYVRSPELLQRWSEYAAFGTVMRSHEGNRPGENLQVYDSSQRASFARMTRVFAALAPYRARVLDEAADGLPAIRHGWLVAPGTAAASVDTQFFLGDDVLVAPVLADGEDRVEVTFPPGEWVHLFTGERYAEGVRAVDAPPGQPAAFARADSADADELLAAFERLS